MRNTRLEMGCSREQIKYLELLFIAKQKYAENMNAPSTEAADHKLTYQQSLFC
jgi:hypothetical protein